MNDSGGKFATGTAGVLDSGGKFGTAKIPAANMHLKLLIFFRIFEKFETALMVYSGAWGKLIHKKPEVVPLSL